MSLLEVVIALFMIGILLGIGLIAYNGKKNDKNLREAAIEIEALASKARTLAFMKQTSYRLTIPSANTVILEQPSPSGSGYAQRETYNGNVEISLRRWGAKDDDWLLGIGDKQNPEPIHWYFSPSGLCEPVSIRLMEGSNWIVLHMDPLTGRVQEEESYIK